jgi:hypothetical protein
MVLKCVWYTGFVKLLFLQQESLILYELLANAMQALLLDQFKKLNINSW